MGDGHRFFPGARCTSRGRGVGHDFDQLVRDTAHHHALLLIATADQSVEFFAVATETFFEETAPAASKHPELYLSSEFSEPGSQVCTGSPDR